MHKLVFEEPYEFVPPGRGKFWPWIIGKYLPRITKKRFGIVKSSVSGLDNLRSSLAANHGIILSGNHSRLSDPILHGLITTQTPCLAFAMASWHVFKQNWLETFVCQRIGGFSVYREGLDRKALELGIEIVAKAERPLIIFGEGVISSANDRLLPLMDGIGFVARSAARRRAKTHPDTRVVIHPVSFKYQHEGDPEELLAPVLDRLESNVFWRKQTQLPVLQRILKLRTALQSAREIQFLGYSLEGDTAERIQQLSDLIVRQHERKWLKKARTGDIVSRVKDLRSTILPDMVAKKVTEEERQSRWRDLTDLYYAQCFSLHPVGYLNEDVPEDRLRHHMFETVERIEEELTDQMTNFQDLTVHVSMGEALPVATESTKRGLPDPLMTKLRQSMLDLMGIKDLWPLSKVSDLVEES